MIVDPRILREQFYAKVDEIRAFHPQDEVRDDFQLSTTKYQEQFVHLPYHYTVETTICKFITDCIIDMPYINIPEESIMYDR